VVVAWVFLGKELAALRVHALQKMEKVVPVELTVLQAAVGRMARVLAVIPYLPAQSVLFGPVVQDHSHQHGRLTNDKPLH
jgi:hypothetical protein